MDAIKLSLHRFRLGGASPHLAPVTICLFSADVEHIFGRVCVIVTFVSAIPFEVIKESSRVLSNVAEVDGLASSHQEEKSVKFLEENSGRLMDRAENSLSRVRQFAEECNDRPSTLRVKTRCRFVEEDQQRRFRSELDPDGQKLALLHVEAFSGGTNNGLCEIFHGEHFDNLFHEFILFRDCDCLWLAEVGRETEGFPDSSAFEVEILLLDIATGKMLDLVFVLHE